MALKAKQNKIHFENELIYTTVGIRDKVNAFSM